MVWPTLGSRTAKDQIRSEEVLQWYYRKFPIVAVEPAAAAPELSMGWVGLGLPQQVLKT